MTLLQYEYDCRRLSIMAGKIVADTLEHSTAGSVDTQYVVNGS